MPRRRKTQRKPLSRTSVLQAAMGIADTEGVPALSMRRLASELGVEAMSLYNHVDGKDDILDGIVEMVAQETALKDPPEGWREMMRSRAILIYQSVVRHPWASALMESRPNPIPSRLRSCDDLIATLRQAGFEMQLAYYAFRTLDSYTYGFAHQEVNSPFEKDEIPDDVLAMRPLLSQSDYPNISEMIGYVMEVRDGDPSVGSKDQRRSADFEFGLELILDGLERVLASDTPNQPNND